MSLLPAVFCSLLLAAPASALPAPAAALPAPVDAIGEARVAGRSLAAAQAHPRVQQSLARQRTVQAGHYLAGLARRPDWSSLVDDALEDAGLPAFLAAVPLVESGYSNWGQPGSASDRVADPARIPGRGLWMFIAPTARAYGLQVDADRDERLDPHLETAAAVALLSDLYDEQGDWGLALAAYNQGSAAVDRAVAAGGTRDVLALIDQGLLAPYVAHVLAASVLLESDAPGR